MTSFLLGSILLICTAANAAAQDTLLLFHPTAYNLEVILRLSEDEMFPPDNYHVLGVYHEMEEYNYEETEKYIKRNRIKNFSLEAIPGTLNQGNLFGQNVCTEQFQKLFRISRGALFMGGPDIPPRVYNEPVHLLTRVTDPYRHFVEASYIFHLLGGSQNPDWKPFMEYRQNYLVSGICLGMQTMNVATGGTLIQDIPTELYGIWSADSILSLPPDQMHRNYTDMTSKGCEETTSYHFHQVQLMENTFLNHVAGSKSGNCPMVLSSHHQAAENLGNEWVIAAQSMDGNIIEAMEHRHYPNVFGVQFHPEKPGLFDPSVIHQRSCNSTINFQEIILNTDSYRFHKEYWRYLDHILRGSGKH